MSERKEKKLGEPELESKSIEFISNSRAAAATAPTTNDEDDDDTCTLTFIASAVLYLEHRKK